MSVYCMNIAYTGSLQYVPARIFARNPGQADTRITGYSALHSRHQERLGLWQLFNVVTTRHRRINTDINTGLRRQESNQYQGRINTDINTGLRRQESNQYQGRINADINTGLRRQESNQYTSRINTDIKTGLRRQESNQYQGRINTGINTGIRRQGK